jgi:hypothetical protein
VVGVEVVVGDVERDGGSAVVGGLREVDALPEDGLEVEVGAVDAAVEEGDDRDQRVERLGAVAVVEVRPEDEVEVAVLEPLDEGLEVQQCVVDAAADAVADVAFVLDAAGRRVAAEVRAVGGGEDSATATLAIGNNT